MQSIIFTPFWHGNQNCILCKGIKTRFGEKAKKQEAKGWTIFVPSTFAALARRNNNLICEALKICSLSNVSFLSLWPPCNCFSSYASRRESTVNNEIFLAGNSAEWKNQTVCSVERSAFERLLRISRRLLMDSIARTQYTSPKRRLFR
jgi:hypothetical protein